ncbi:MAG: ComEC/Rec2 family competence protein [Pseudomonadota bacterium]
MSSASFYEPSIPVWLTPFEATLEGQRRQLILWWPVAFGAGVIAYFTLSSEPSLLVAGVCALFGALLLVASPKALLSVSFPMMLIAAMLLGGAMATLRTAHVGAPVLSGPVATTVEGRIREVSRSASGNPRIELDQVILYERHAQPARVRIALVGNRAPITLRPGDCVRLHARLSPPSPPVEPGGYDFRRHAFFEQLGALGYTTTPVLKRSTCAGGWGITLLRWRHDISRGIQSRMEGRTGAFAAAILVGDRANLPVDTLEALRASNLAHLLAISGLHMGLVSGFVFFALRKALALSPRISLTYNTKKIAAVAAFFAALAFLAISGASVATQRAFIMVTVVFGAVLLDRPPFTLRAVALAATLILLWRPESVLSAGFQMSFAATAALVATFEQLRRYAWWRDAERGFVSRFRPVLALIIASLVAGFATAPFGAFHFNQSASYGLIANLLTVPVMSLFVMPAGVVAALLAPFGLEGLALMAMGVGIEWILRVAETVASLPGATRAIPMGPPIALALIVAGGLWLILWRGAGRVLGLAPMLLALPLWATHPRPDILISADARVVGVLTEEGRALSARRGSGFAVETWAEHDAQPISRETAVGLWTGQRGRDQAVWDFATGTRLIWSREGTPNCSDRDVVVTPSQTRPNGCQTITPDDLRHGGVSVFVTPNGFELRYPRADNRPWAPQ